MGKRVNLEILNVKGLNLSFLATPDAFKLQVQHCRYHSLQRNMIKLQLNLPKLEENSPMIVNNLDLLRSFFVGPPTHSLTA